ncbi:MAG: GNAT family N-acetyltransferase [Solirubrobacterales bacterium]|nr:GNAT family N-acetyltransferase [Solirubrobacterales bacterium]
MDGRVRIAAAADAPEVARLLNDFRIHLDKQRPGVEEILASVQRILSEDSGEFLLAGEDGGPPAGVCQLRYRWSVWTSSEDCWLEDLFVSEQQRGGGLGEALVEAAIERAAARGCRRVELDVYEHDEAPRSLYRKLGFSADSKGRERSLLLGLDPARPGA